MKLKIPKREGTFKGSINLRTENHGDKHVQAADLTVSFIGTKRDIDNIVPLATGKFTEKFYDKGQFLARYLSPLAVHREPEALVVNIYDKGKTKPLTFKNSKAAKIVIDIDEKYMCKVSMQLQLYVADGQVDRLRRILSETVEFDLESAQDDVFTEDGDDAPEEGGDEAQSQLAASDAEEDEDDDD